MVDQNLLTIFIAVTSVAVLIQAGILVGLYFLVSKMMKQANRAVEQTQLMFGPVSRMIAVIQSASDRLAKVSASVQTQAREFHNEVAKAESSWKRTLDRWAGIGA
jgi:hypothetical protein